MTKEHVAFGASGKVVTLDGVPVEDDSPVMKAIDGLLKVADRRAKLLGLNAPTKHEVITLDSVQAEIRRLEAQLGEIDELDAIEAEAGGTQGA